MALNLPIQANVYRSVPLNLYLLSTYPTVTLRNHLPNSREPSGQHAWIKAKGW